MATTELHSEKISTRERLLRAAMKSFGHYDYDSVSTRKIVDQAGVNISAISYHFGGKKGLYLATAEYISDQIHAEISPLLTHITASLVQSDKEGCYQLLQQLIEGMVKRLVFADISTDAAGLIFREQNHPTKAFDSLYEKFMLPIQRTYAQLVGRIMERDPEEFEVKLLTHALIGQILNYRIGRETILRRTGKKKFNRNDIDIISSVIYNASLKAIS